MLRDLRVRVQNKYGSTTPEYKLFGFENVVRLNDANLLHAGRCIAHICSLHLSVLSEYGLTNAHLLQLKNACDGLETLMIEQSIKTGERAIAQEKRVTLGNSYFLLKFGY